MAKLGQPTPSSWSRPYWDAVAEGRLVFQRCDSCIRAVFPPRKFCPNCASPNFSWEDSAGTGSVYSYSVVERGALEEFKADLPYVVAVVELDEGYRMVSRIVDSQPDDVGCDVRVRVRIGEDGSRLPVFVLEPTA